ncbi:hypothetical protein Bca4012_075712 [Brassica carinata]
MQDDSKLRRDLTAANQVISELQADNQANRTHIRSLAGMFDVLSETNPALAQMWQVVHSAITPRLHSGRAGGYRATGRSP